MILNDSEIIDINQNAEFDSAIGYARKIEAAVLEKLKAQERDRNLLNYSCQMCLDTGVLPKAAILPEPPDIKCPNGCSPNNRHLQPDVLKAQDKGPWKSGKNELDNRVFVESDDFTHDVRLYIDGDFGGYEERLAYADGIADALNHPLPQDDVVRDAERYRWLVDNSYDRDGFLQFQVWKHSWEPHSQTGIPIEWKCRVRGPAIDAAIDAAMGKMK